jgi:hypothetical protein
MARQILRNTKVHINSIESSSENSVSLNTTYTQLSRVSTWFGTTSYSNNNKRKKLKKNKLGRINEGVELNEYYISKYAFIIISPSFVILIIVVYCNLHVCLNNCSFSLEIDVPHTPLFFAIMIISLF